MKGVDPALSDHSIHKLIRGDWSRQLGNELLQPLCVLSRTQWFQAWIAYRRPPEPFEAAGLPMILRFPCGGTGFNGLFDGSGLGANQRSEYATPP